MEVTNQTDELILTGNDLTVAKLVQTAQQVYPKVRISDASIVSMYKNRKFAEDLADKGVPVYGLTTGVGVRKNRLIPSDVMDDYNYKMLQDHATGQGASLPNEIVHASTILLLNSLAMGRSNVRPSVAQHITQKLCQGNISFSYTCYIFNLNSSKS